MVFREVCAGWLLAVVLAIPTGCFAQEIGDRVRLRLSTEDEWRSGTLVDYSQGALLVRGEIFDDPGAVYLVSEIQRADWYDEPSLAGGLLLGAGLMVTFELVSPCNPDPVEGDCWTGSRGSELALNAGIGAVVGAIWHLVRPDKWKTWIEDGREAR